MLEGIFLGNQHIGGNREDDPVRTLFFFEFGHFDLPLGVIGSGTEEDGNPVIYDLDGLFDDFLFFIRGQQGDFCCGTQDEKLIGPVLDLPVDQDLESVEIDVTVLFERDGHSHPGTC